MKTKDKRYQRLVKAMERGDFVRLRCQPEMKWAYEGYVVGLSKKFVLIQNGHEAVFLNGYSVFPLRTIKKVKIKRDSVIHRALQMDGFAPTVPGGIVLDDWPSLLASADAYFPLVSLHPGHRDPDTCYIGRVSDLKKRSVKLREIDPKAIWVKELGSYRFKDITEVDFGGRYEAALWRVAQADAETRDISL